VVKVITISTVVAISAALALAGCSLFMKTNPKNWEPRLAPTRSKHKLALLLDTIAAGAGVAAAGYGAVCLTLEDGDTARERCTRFALVPGIAAAVFEDKEDAPLEHWVGELELPPVEVVVTAEMLGDQLQDVSFVVGGSVAWSSGFRLDVITPQQPLARR